MAKDHLQEYLISLGFDVDKEKLRKFREGAAVAAREVTELGGAAIATATAIGYMVEKAARSYEDLYYVSQRTGRSVIALKAYEYASRQVGVSAETARAQTEAFYATLRTNPGMRGLLGNLGGTEAGGPAGLVSQLKKRFGESGYFVASRFAQMFGIDEQTFRTYWLNVERLAAEQQDSLKRQREAGVSAQENAQLFRDYANSVNHLEDNFSILTTRIAQDFLPTANKLLPWLDNLLERFNRADNESGGTLGVAAGAGVAGLPLLLLKRGRGLFATALGKGGGAMGPVLELLELMKHDSQNGNQVRTILRKAFGIEDPGEAAPWAGAKPGGGNTGSTGSTIDYFVKQGWSREQAAGIAANLSRESGFNPGAVGDGGAAFGIAQWHPDRQAEFKRVFGKDIRDSTLKEQLAFVQYELTKGRETAAGDALRGAKTAEEAGSLVSRLYERPASVAAEAASRALEARQLFGSGVMANASPGDPPGLVAARQMFQQRLDMARGMGFNIGPAPSTVSAAAPVINHDTDINIYGNADQAAQTAIVNAQYDIYSQAIRNNLSRVR